MTIIANDFDGILAINSLIELGVNFTIFPRQLISVKDESGVEKLFVHGAPGSTSLTSAVTVQHKRMRRGMLERRGVPTTKGATFTIGRGITQALRYADRIGYPVTVSPAKGDPGLYMLRNINNKRELKLAINKMKVPVHARDGVFRGSYTPMELGQPGKEKGVETVTPSYRILVEKQPKGIHLRSVVVDGRIVSAIRCDGSPLDGSYRSGIDVVDNISVKLQDLILRTAATVPDLSAACIDLVVNDISEQFSAKKSTVVELSERPFLWVQDSVEPNVAAQISMDMVASYLGKKQDTVSRERSEVTIKFSIESLPAASEAAKRMEELCSQRSLACSFTAISDLEGRVSGNLIGDLTTMSVLLNEITNDVHPDVPAMLVDVTY